jgi:hypothetical protein
MKIMVSYFLATAFSLAVVVSPVVYAQDKQARDTMNRAAGVARFDRMHEARSPTDEAVKLLSSGNAASLAKADPRSIALLQFLLSEFKQYELNVTYGGGRNSHPDKRFQGGRRIEDFMKYVSDPARIARTQERFYNTSRIHGINGRSRVLWASSA